MESDRRSLSYPLVISIIVLIMGCLISYALFAIIDRLNSERIRNQIQIDAQRHIHILESSLASTLAPLEALHAFYRSSDSVYREEFNTFVAPLLAGHSEIQAFAWVPRTAGTDISSHEKIARREGVAQFVVHSWQDHQEMEMLRNSQSYFPVYVIEPASEYASLLGLDLSSHPALAEAVNWSCDQGEMVASQPIDLHSSASDVPLVIVILPAYESDKTPPSTGERRNQLNGFVAAFCRVDRLIGSTISSQDEQQFDIYVYDLMAKPGNQLLYSPAKPADNIETTTVYLSIPDSLRTRSYSAALRLTDRLYTVQYFAKEEYLEELRTHTAAAALILGTLLSVLLALGVLVTLRRSARLRSICEELRSASEKLEQDIRQRHRANSQFRFSEKLYRSAIDAASDMMHVVDKRMCLTLANQSLLKRCAELGLCTDIVGKNVLDVFPFLTERVKDEYREAFKTGRNVISGEENTVADRQVITETRKIPVYDDGEVTHVITLISDVTRAKGIEHAMRLTQFSVDRTSDAAFWMGPDARFLYVNEAACRLLGYSREEFLGMTVHDIDPNFSPEAWPKHWQDLQQFRSFAMESIHRTKEGHTIPVEVFVNYIELEGKQYNCAFARDLSETKQKDSLQAGGEDFFRCVADQLGLGIAIVSPSLKVHYLNRQMNEWFPEPDSSKKQCCYRQLNTPPLAEPCENCPVRLTLGDGDSHEAIITRYVNNQKQSLRIFSSPIKDQRGHVVAAVEIIADVKKHDLSGTDRTTVKSCP